jgi:hypothetical protein
MLNSGQVAIVDAQGVQWNFDGQAAVPTANGSMLVGQTLLQVRPTPHAAQPKEASAGLQLGALLRRAPPCSRPTCKCC